MNIYFLLVLGLGLGLMLDGTAFAAEPTLEQKRRMMLLTTTFENSFPKGGSPSFAYDYIENLGDGRGYTAGRIGFCSGTHDMLALVEAYTKTKPKNPLAKHLPELRRISKVGGGPDVSGLTNFIADWKAAAKDEAFKKAQDAVADSMYFQPAMRIADRVGVKLPFGKAILYDTIIMHGGGTDADSIGAIVERASKRACPNKPCDPKSGASEKAWLKLFLEERRKVLADPANTATKTEWSKNTYRAEVLSEMLQSGKYDKLDKPMQLKNYYFDGLIP